MSTAIKARQEPIDLIALKRTIAQHGLDLGFQQIGISGVALDEDERHLQAWLARGFHGDMAYMQGHGVKRSRPAQLIPGTVCVISARMNYLPSNAGNPWNVLDDDRLGYISRYALGKDYHRLMRKRFQQLADRVRDLVGPFGYRVFVDSAPVLEKALARNAGLGWIGKHTNLIHRSAGSWFFLGEIFTDLPLPIDPPETKNYCGRCTACIEICPTRAIIAPYQLDARLCISYLTIEHPGSIPEALRPLIGNRIYGCDDCQLVCPWNRFARPTEETAFRARKDLVAPQLIDLFRWNEDEFLKRTEGSAIRRIGYQRWLRNIAVALGNASPNAETKTALLERSEHTSEMVREHTIWALNKQAM
jgi:epoxyqueuosine reductase